jgi:Kdo2-lipid IVA lauroyltransferase/acyltransferase
MSKKRNLSTRSAYHPKYWIIWLLVGLFRLILFLPYPVLLKLGHGIGHMLLRFSGKSEKTARINLALCFPELSLAERETLLRKNFESAGIAVFEMGLAWWGSESKLRHLGHIHGMKHLEQALQKNKGVIFCGAHFLTLELIGRLLIPHLPFAVMYRPQKNPVLDKLAYYYRKKMYQKIIARDDLRGMLKWLKANKIVWYTPDIDAGLKNSIFVPFFGIQAASITATSRLAEISQAVVVPIFYYRRDNESGYDICIEPALENFPSGSLEQDTLRINQIIETAVRKKPEQYLWQYKRFKTRPNGEQRFY